MFFGTSAGPALGSGPLAKLHLRLPRLSTTPAAASLLVRRVHRSPCSLVPSLWAPAWLGRWSSAAAPAAAAGLTLRIPRRPNSIGGVFLRSSQPPLFPLCPRSKGSPERPPLTQARNVERTPAKTPALNPTHLEHVSAALDCARNAHVTRI